MTKSRFADMSLESLERLQQENMAKKDALREEMLAVKEAIDEKAALRQAQETLVGMSPGQVDAIARVARAQMTAVAKDAG